MYNKPILIVGNLAQDIIFGEERFGGSAALIAVTLSNLGIPTGIMSVAGQDEFSKRYLQFLLSKGINLDLVEMSLDSLPRCTVFATENEDSSSTWEDNGCHDMMNRMGIKEELLNRYGVIHLISCSFNLARKIAFGYSGAISYEPGPQLLHDETFLDIDVLKRSNMVFFNEAEWIRAKEILGISSPEQLISNPRQILTITYGERGSEIYHFTGTEVTVEIIEPIKVDNVIDHTGAGDNYKAGFLASYSTGRELREAGMLGSLLGARAVENQGGILPPSVITEASANFKVK